MLNQRRLWLLLLWLKLNLLIAVPTVLLIVGRVYLVLHGCVLMASRHLLRSRSGRLVVHDPVAIHVYLVLLRVTVQLQLGLLLLLEHLVLRLDHLVVRLGILARHSTVLEVLSIARHPADRRVRLAALPVDVLPVVDRVLVVFVFDVVVVVAQV